MPRPKAPTREETNRSLLDKTSSELIAELPTEPDAKYLRKMAYSGWDAKAGAEYQVHVMVVRDPDEFLGPFDTEVMN